MVPNSVSSGLLIGSLGCSGAEGVRNGLRAGPVDRVGLSTIILTGRGGRRAH